MRSAQADCCGTRCTEVRFPGWSLEQRVHRDTHSLWTPEERDCSVACRPTCLASCVSPQPRVESVAGIAVRHFESGPHFAKTKNVILPNNEIEDCAKVHTFSV